MRWNRTEIGDIFKRFEVVEASIVELQEHEDRNGGLVEGELVDLWGLLSSNHSFFRQQKIFWR